MLNIVCHRQSEQPPKLAGVYVEHVSKLRHAVLLCAQNALACGYFALALFVFISFYFILGSEGRFCIRLFIFMVEVCKRAEGYLHRHGCMNFSDFSWELCFKFYSCWAHLGSYIIQSSDSSLVW